MKKFLRRKGLLCVLGLLLMGLSLSVLLTGQPALPTGAWGLSFPQPGQTPVGNADAEQLRRYGAAYVGSGEEKRIYLTFDAGYENGCTAQILDVLQKQQVPASFFLVGNYMEQNPELVRRMAQEGHTVGNHTYHHYDMSQIQQEERFAAELLELEELYTEITGEELAKFYRPPRGIYSEENLAMAKKLGYRTVFWSLAYVDWLTEDQPTSQEAYDKLIPRIHPGAVVLLHSTSETNAAILEDLIGRWKELGYCFGTLEELFSEMP